MNIKKTLVLYVFHEKNDRVNHFLKNAIFKDDNTQFVVISNKKNNEFEVPDYVIKIMRDNVGFDFGGWSDAILTNNLYQSYDNFIFVNSSVMGPYLPSNYIGKWTDIYINGLNDNVKLFGSTINTCSDPLKSHVQSYIFSMDKTTLEFLIKSEIFSITNYAQTFTDAVYKKEILMSRKIIENGWNIGSLLKYYDGIDFTFKKQNKNITWLDDVMFSQYRGSLWDEYDLVFIKGNRVKINLLEILGKRYGTDKITYHGYHRFYHDVLKHLCDKKFNMMEIGVYQFKSVDMWKEYFPHAKIYGLDIGSEYRDERLTIYRADQSKKEDLRDVISKMNVRCDFINDDGSHIPEHQLLTFDVFFNELLNDGGIYIIEDIEISYWKRGDIYGYQMSYGYQHYASIVEKFKIIVDFINSKFLGPNDYAALLQKIGGGISIPTLISISSITFVQNCIIIKKKEQEDYKYTRKDEPYRFIKNV